MFDVDGVKFVLSKIQRLEKMNSPNQLPTHRNIWAGSYDVLCCEQDKIDAIEIPKARMKEAEDAGFIKSETKQVGKYEFIIWTLTDLGKAFLEERDV